MNKQRNLVHLELLRILAIYCVIFNHTDGRGFLLFSVAKNPIAYNFYLFLSIACKVAVPLFFMISGALLLKKEESIGTVYRKRVLRMVVILIGISLIYTIYYDVRDGKAFDTIAFLKTIYSSRSAVALWYLYMFIGFLAMLPLLRKMAKNLSAKEYVYLGIMSILLSGVLPILQCRLWQDTLKLNENALGTLFTSKFLVCFLMGYFFEYVLPEKYYTLRNAIYALIISVIAIGICCYMTTYRARVTGDYSGEGLQTFHNSLIAIPSYSLYFCGKLLFMKKKFSERFCRMVCFFGSMTFGIFLFEKILRELTIGVFYRLEPVIPFRHVWCGCLRRV